MNKKIIIAGLLAASVLMTARAQMTTVTRLLPHSNLTPQA